MFRNYLKIAWRNIVKHRFYSAINISGLTVGMTCCFLIFMYVRFELSYDTFHRQADRIYRVSTDVKTPTELIQSSVTSAPMGPALKADFPEVLDAVRVNAASWLIQQGNNKYQEDKILLADSSFFDVFSFRLLKGNPASVLRANMYYTLHLEKLTDVYLRSSRDEAFDRLYRTDYRLGLLILYAAVLAIVIASLGLPGLISYIVTQRTREIGIRKVLGAFIVHLLLLLSRNFLKLVAIAMLIATPVAWYVMHRWLQDFAYRIHIEWWIFLLAGLGAVVIAMVTIGIQSVKAALVNPVKSLRTE